MNENFMTISTIGDKMLHSNLGIGTLCHLTLSSSLLFNFIEYFFTYLFKSNN